MAFSEVNSLDSDFTISLGGRDKKTGKENPKQVTGYYLGTKGGLPNKYNPEKPSQLHFLQTEKGNVGVWGKTDLDRKITAVSPGTMVRITFTGTRPSNKGNDMLVFKVEVDKDNTIEVSTPAPVSFQDDSTDSFEEAGLDDEDEALDEIAPARPVAPRAPAAAPSAERQAKVLAALNARKTAR